MGLHAWCERQEGGFWGMVVVFAAFMIQIPSFGTAQSFGIYNMYLLDYFKNDSTAAVSLVGSINVGVFLGSGPIASFLMNHFSHRKVSLLGAVLSTIGLIGIPFTPSLLYMYAFYGVLAGLGFCLVYVPSHVLSGLYYDKKRGIATGIATSGSGFGAIIYPLLVNVLVENYGWKGSFYIICGISMQNFIFAGLLRPVPKTLLEKYKKAEEERSIAADTVNKVESVSVKLTAYKCNTNEEIKVTYNGDGIHRDDIHLEMKPEPLDEDSQTEIWEIDSHRASQSVENDKKEINQPLSEDAENDTFEEGDTICNEELEYDEVIEGIEKELEQNREEHVDSGISSVPKSPEKLLSVCESKQSNITEKPLDRVSLNAVEIKNLSHKSTLEILCNYTFIIFFFNNIFWNMGLVIILLFGPEYMTSIGLTEKEASLVFSIGGIGAIIGSILGGFLGNFEKLRLDLLYIVIVACVGITALLFPVSYFHSFAGMTVLYIIFSIFANIIMGLLVIVVAAILGPDALGVGMGYVMLANGIGSVVAPPLTGWVFELTGSIEMAFYMGGAIVLFSGLIIILIPVLDCFYLEPEKPSSPDLVESEKVFFAGDQSRSSEKDKHLYFLTYTGRIAVIESKQIWRQADVLL